MRLRAYETVDDCVENVPKGSVKDILASITTSIVALGGLYFGYYCFASGLFMMSAGFGCRAYDRFNF